ncbi:flavin monoamine oxidase family protein [Streptomyces sp. NPDC088801]|uniref:flavin monoamine oxidase family protein n=1 Tax=Streptomyces sp. NPDC088801 TaxID=3365903 RepID=UPI0038265382
MPSLESRHDVVVVGAGPAGLTAATTLRTAGLDVVCMEARDRVGGRLASIDGYDLGATWFWDGEQRVAELVAQLGVTAFEQHRTGDAIMQDRTGIRRITGNPIDAPAYRFGSGAHVLAAGLAARLPEAALRLSTPVTRIRLVSEMVQIDTPCGTLRAAQVVLAVPPALAVARIDFNGDLGPDLIRLAEATPVWMGAIAKVVAGYRTPFWRASELAGAAISHTGPLRETHDMSGPHGDRAALFGFSAAAALGHGFETSVTAQLARLFGPEAAEPTTLHVQDWSAEQWTSPAGVGNLTDYGLLGHPHYRQPALAGRLHWASTETAADYAGHIEGALYAGRQAATAVLTAHAGAAEAKNG